MIAVKNIVVDPNTPRQAVLSSLPTVASPAILQGPIKASAPNRPIEDFTPCSAPLSVSAAGIRVVCLKLTVGCLGLLMDASFDQVTFFLSQENFVSAIAQGVLLFASVHLLVVSLVFQLFGWDYLTSTIMKDVLESHEDSVPTNDLLSVQQMVIANLPLHSTTPIHSAAPSVETPNTSRSQSAA